MATSLSTLRAEPIVPRPRRGGAAPKRRVRRVRVKRPARGLGLFRRMLTSFVPKRDIPGADRVKSWIETAAPYWAALKVRLDRFCVLTQKWARDSLTPMNAVRVAPGRWMNVVLMAIGLVLMMYFSYHAVAGNRGWFALVDLEARRDALTQELAIVRRDRERFERRVDLLDRGQIDPDLLEESARSTLGYVQPGDLVIYRRD